MPADIRARCAVRARPDLQLPCFILEAEGDFELLSEAEALAALATIRPESRMSRSTEANEDEPVLVNLYRFAEEFAPRRPGADYMGAIPHWHLGARDLAQISRYGLSVLWTGSPVGD